MTDVSDRISESPPGIIHGLGLAELFEIVRGRAVLVGAWTVAGLLVSMALAFSIVPTYESTATVMIDPREHRVVDIDQNSWLNPLSTAVVKDFAAGFDRRSLGDRVVEVALDDFCLALED